MNKIKEFNLLGHVTINKSGLYEYNSYYWNQRKRSFYEYNDEFINFINNVQSINNNVINSNDVLYIDSKIKFPKRLLNRLNIDIKRTIKKEKCNKYIIDINVDEIYKQGNNQYNMGYMIFQPNNATTLYLTLNDINDYKTEFGYDLEDLQNIIVGNWVKYIEISNDLNLESFTYLNNNKYNYVNLNKVIEYINSKLPFIDDNTFNSLSLLLQSNAIDKSIALKLITDYNVSDRIYEICEALGNSSFDFDDKTKNSINYKYFIKLIGYRDLKRLRRYWGYRWGDLQMYSIIFNNGIMTNAQKYKFWDKFYKSITDQGNEEIVDYNLKLTNYQISSFMSYNMPITYDQNGTSESSNREMEESGLQE